ncbi:hypothetical protein [uncultured Tateyamaria sp.]|uniref:hypothetical protein n=1 Tax=uncultured Tateyamaria sp. TaxID=455651 RepID=UPI00262EF7B0|nr:hypothetical protein [uncultured Tateyamaria sp.]
MKLLFGLVRTLLFCTILSLAFVVIPDRAIAGPVTANSEQVRAFIRHYEATSDYDLYHPGMKRAPPRPLTQMTVGEVMAWQKSQGDVISTASGAYQIIQRTLRGLVNKHGIDRNALFDRQMQDHLADLLLLECKARRNNVVRYGNCIAYIWAALPLLSGPNTGKSAYDGIAGNRALTTTKNFMTLLQGNGGQLTQLVDGGAAVLSYRERVAQMQAEIDAERELGQAAVWNMRTYSN